MLKSGQENVYLQYHSFILEISNSFTLVFERHSTLCHLLPGRWQNGFCLQLSTHHSTPPYPSLPLPAPPCFGPPQPSTASTLLSTFLRSPFLHSRNEWDLPILIFLCLAYFTYHINTKYSSPRVIANGTILSFLMVDWYLAVGMCTFSSGTQSVYLCYTSQYYLVIILGIRV